MPHKPPNFRNRFAPAPTPDARPSSARRGYDRAWARLRLAHLREHPLCVLCEAQGRTTGATVVDHRVPIEVAPERRLDPANLRSLCVDHHNACTANYRTTRVNEPPRAAGAKA